MGFNRDEDMALCKAITPILEYAKVGMNMSQMELASRVHAAFGKFAPEGAGTGLTDKGPLDRRRWSQRPPQGLVKRFYVIKAASLKMNSVFSRLASLDLKGTTEQLWRAATYCYNNDNFDLGKIYDAMRNPEYVVGVLFPFRACYEFLRDSTDHLKIGNENANVGATGGGDHGGLANGNQPPAPLEDLSDTRSAKRTRREEESMAKAMEGAAAALQAMTQGRDAVAASKSRMNELKLQIEEERFQFELFNTVFREENGGTEEERQIIAADLRRMAVARARTRAEALTTLRLSAARATPDGQPLRRTAAGRTETLEDPVVPDDDDVDE